MSCSVRSEWVNVVLFLKTLVRIVQGPYATVSSTTARNILKNIVEILYFDLDIQMIRYYITNTGEHWFCAALIRIQ